MQPVMINPINIEIARKAAEETEKDSKNLPSSKMRDMLAPVAIGTFITSRAALTPGTLSTKLRAGGREAGFWAVVGATLFGMNKISDKIAEKNENYKKFKQNQPILNLLAEIAVLIAGTTLAIGGIRKGKIAFLEKLKTIKAKNGSFTEKLQNLLFKKAKVDETGLITVVEKSGIEKTADEIDTSKLGKITEDLKSKFQNFSDKYPVVNKIINDKTITWGTIIGWLTGSIALNSKVQSDKEKMFKEKLSEEIAKTYMA